VNPTPPPVHPGARTDGKAIASLVCGLLSVSCLSIITGIPAVILGHMSRSSIQKSMGQLKGQGMALAGLIMGYVSIALIPIMVFIIATIAIPSLLRSRQAANESAAVANLRTINTVETTYVTGDGAGKYGDVDALIGAQLIDDSFKQPKAGYRYSIIADGASYTATVNPASPNTGRYGFYSTTDGKVRYSIDPTLAPPGQAGLPVLDR
jgi:type II secretory pathway pseudopilin PulG